MFRPTHRMKKSCSTSLAARRFWVIQHGIKASAMPAWSNAGMADAAIWDLTAFLGRLPALSAEQQRSMVSASDGHSHQGWRRRAITTRLCRVMWTSLDKCATSMGSALHSRPLSIDGLAGIRRQPSWSRLLRHVVCQPGRGPGERFSRWSGAWRPAPCQRAPVLRHHGATGYRCNSSCAR